MTLLVINKQLPIEALNLDVFNSQSCENTFRTARSSSGPFSSVTNFSVKEFLRICQKLSIINSIKNCQQNTNIHRLRFPHHHKSDKRTSHHYDIDSSRSFELTEDGIEKIIDRAFEAAREYVRMANMGGNNNMGSLSDLSRYIKMELKRSTLRVTNRMADADTGESSDESSTQSDPLHDTKEHGSADEQVTADDSDNDERQEAGKNNISDDDEQPDNSDDDKQREALDSEDDDEEEERYPSSSTDSDSKQQSSLSETDHEEDGTPSSGVFSCRCPATERLQNPQSNRLQTS